MHGNIFEYSLVGGGFDTSEALASATFDLLNCQHTGESDQNFSKKPHGRGSARGGGGGTWAVLGLTGTEMT